MAKQVKATQLISEVDKLAAQFAELYTQIKKNVDLVSSAQSTFNKQSKSQGELATKTKAVKTALSSVEKIQVRANNITLESVRATEALRKKRKALTDQVKKEQGTFKKSGSLFKSMTKSVLAAGAAMLGFRAAINVFKKVITTLKDFETAMSKVKAITNATDKEFKALRKDALRLGSTTSKTATQVAELQTEFAKLGFSTTEILAATEATIQLSIAAGTDLANAAEVAGSTVRGFGLSANETQRVVDVMAKSFASSALDMEKFKVAMSKVAPVAKASGKTIEFATAQLGILADSGLEASIAGTSLRNIFLELSKQGLTWEEGLEKINKSTDKSNTALQLFGKRGATAGLILADNVKKAGEFEIALDGASGAAKEMADIMEDNLSGELARTKSKWEGFIQSLENGEGGLASVTRAIVKLWGSVAEGFEILSGGQDAFLTKQLEAIYSDDINKRVQDNLKIAKEQVGVDKAITELKEDQVRNLAWENELRQQILETTDKDKKRRLEQELIEVQVLDSVLKKTIAAEEDAKNVAIDAAEEAARVKAELAKQTAEKIAKEQFEIDEEVEQERLTAFQKAKKEQEELELAADKALIEKKKLLLEGNEADKKAALITALEEEYELKLKAQEAEAQLEDDWNDARIEMKQAAASAAGQALSDQFAGFIDNDLAAFQAGQDAEQKILDDRLDKGALTEKEYEKESADLEKKGRIESAKAAKKKAIFDATLSAAVSVINQLAATPLPLGAPFIAAAGVIGATQIALATAQPIPKYKHGTDGKLQIDTTAIVGDGGQSELITTPYGNFLSPSTDTMVHLPRGSQVFGGDSPETQAALSGGMSDEHYNGLIKEQQLTRKAIASQPKNITNLTDKGLEYAYIKKQTRINLRDEWLR